MFRIHVPEGQDQLMLISFGTQSRNREPSSVVEQLRDLQPTQLFSVPVIAALYTVHSSEGIDSPSARFTQVCYAADSERLDQHLNRTLR